MASCRWQMAPDTRSHHTTATSTRDGESLRIAGVFAGVGGIERGLRQAKHRTELLCEFDDAAQDVLRAQFNAPIVGDVRELRAGEIPPVDVLAGGFPCQDLSQAGRTRGIRGRQSSLVFEMFRLVENMRPTPRWVLLENVPFMLRLDRGGAMHYLTTWFSSRGFRWAYRVVDARSFGRPQRRRRVIMLASRVADPREVLFADEAGQPDLVENENTAYGFYWTEGVRGLGWGVDCIPTLKGGSTVGIPSPPAIWLPGGEIILPDIRDAERLQGFTENWTKPAQSNGRGRRKGVRWRLVGNAVSVDVSRWVGRCLARPRTPIGADTYRIDDGQSWPNAAWGDTHGRAYKIALSTWPKRYKRVPLAAFLRHEGSKLSLRAARGFRARTKRATSLNFPDGFLAAVDQHIRNQGGRPEDITENTGRRRPR